MSPSDSHRTARPAATYHSLHTIMAERTPDQAATPAAREAPPLRRKLLYILLFALLSLPVAEWGLRFFNIERLPGTNPDLYQLDPELVYVMRPNVRVYSHGCWVETNEHGLRGRDFEDVHAAGDGCVIFFGHSIAFGFGVKPEQAYPDLLSEFTDLPVQGINLGTCGYRYFQEFALAERLAPEIRPVASVVMFTGNNFNDVTDVFNAPVHETDWPGQSWLRKHSALYRYLRRSKDKLLVLSGLKEEQAWGHRLIQGDTEVNLEHWQEYERQLVRLMEVTGTPVILCCFPNGVPEHSYRRVEQMAERIGAHWVDLSVLWEDVPDYLARFSLGWDSHPSAGCHRILAEVFAEAVEEVLTAEREN